VGHQELHALILASAGLASCRLWSNADYGAVFVQDRLVEWQIAVDNDSWHQLMVKPTSFVPAKVTVDGQVFDKVGLRLLGDPNHDKKSMRIKFDFADEDLDFHGVKHVNLRGATGDPTLLRQAMGLELFARAGVPTPRHSFVWLSGFAGDTGGVYTLVEQIDRKFLRDRFGEDSGDLWQLEEGAGLLYVAGSAKGYDVSLYTFELGDESAAPQRLGDFIRALELTPDAQLEQTLSTMLDLDGLLRALAVNTWLADLDSYQGTGGNLYLYRDTGGRFHYIPWDLNRSFGNYHGDPCSYTTDQLLQLEADSPTCTARPLVTRLLPVPSITNRYHQQIRSLLADALDPVSVVALLRDAHQRVEEAAHRDGLKSFSNTQFDASLVTDVGTETATRAPALESFTGTRNTVFRNAVGY
jgi:spore coat protein H